MMLQPRNRQVATFLWKMNCLATSRCVCQLPVRPRSCTGKNKPLIILVLATMTRRLFCISASAAQSERDFLSVGRTITDSRSQLAASKVESIKLVWWGLRAGLIQLYCTVLVTYSHSDCFYTFGHDSCSSLYFVTVWKQTTCTLQSYEHKLDGLGWVS